MLRPAFLVNTISHCSRALRVVWKDGMESVYPSMWLRSSVRDDRFFDQNSFMYEHSHLSFVDAESVLKNASVTRNGEFTILTCSFVHECPSFRLLK